jgi:galactokinase
VSVPSRSLIVNAENTIAQALTGGMDQSAALRSRVGHALLLDCRDGSIAQVPFDAVRVNGPRLHGRSNAEWLCGSRWV